MINKRKKRSNVNIIMRRRSVKRKMKVIYKRKMKDHTDEFHEYVKIEKRVEEEDRFKEEEEEDDDRVEKEEEGTKRPRIRKGKIFEDKASEEDVDGEN